MPLLNKSYPHRGILIFCHSIGGPLKGAAIQTFFDLICSRFLNCAALLIIAIHILLNTI